MSGHQEIGQDHLSGSAFIAIGAEKLSREEQGFFRKWTVPQVDTAQGLAARIIGSKERTDLCEDHGRDEQRRRAYALPVLYDVMGEISVVELLATEYPDVAFIIPHLGSFSDDWKAQLALIDHRQGIVVRSS